ncbi:uncharacterized protein LOC144422921 isoform X2 [Styela clava]
MVSIESDRLILESGKQYKMTLSELSPAPAVASQSTLSAPTGWTDKGVPMGQNLLASRLDARTKMRMSVQEARMRAKLPPSERLPPVLKLSPRANIEPHKEIAAKEILPVEIVNPGTPPPPCNAFDVKKDRSLINNLIRETEFQDQNGNEKKMMEPSKKFVKHICGWNLDYDKYHLKTRSTENRTVCTAKTPQKRTIPSTPTLASDLKIKINLYDRYTANSVGAIFKFFHYADLRLYIKQYRRNHSCGVGQRTHLTSVSPVYENNMYRLTGPPEHTPYYYNATKARDGFVLGVQSTPVTPNIWKANANLPLPSAFRQRYSRERRPPAEEPILSPRVFVRSTKRSICPVLEDERRRNTRSFHCRNKASNNSNPKAFMYRRKQGKSENEARNQDDQKPRIAWGPTERDVNMAHNADDSFMFNSLPYRWVRFDNDERMHVANVGYRLESQSREITRYWRNDF